MPAAAPPHRPPPIPTRALAWGLGVLLAGLLLIPTLDPAVDLTIAGWFWTPGGGFVWRGAPVAEFFHVLVQVVARVLAVGLVMGLGWTAWRRRPLLGLDAKAWAFLTLSLGLGPGLIGNSLLKDHWHRARPAQVRQFGGSAPYTPPLLPAPKANCGRNCSFVSGDAVLAFYLHSFAYGVPLLDERRRRWTRVLFWGGLGIGGLVGVLRIGMGGHFFSDVMYALALAVATSAGLHTAFYGRAATTARWRAWLGEGGGPP